MKYKIKCYWWRIKGFLYYWIGKPFYKPVLEPQIRRVFPSLITPEIFSVQPMVHPVPWELVKYDGEKSTWDIADEYYNKIGISKEELVKRIENSIGVYINYFDRNINEWDILGHIKQNKFLFYKRVGSDKLESIETIKLIRAAMFHNWVHGYNIEFLTSDGKEIKTIPLWELKEINMWRNE